MRWSKLFIPTTREVPAGAEAVSHQLLLRAGYIRQVTAGVYALLPLAQRMRLKIMRIIREEMNKIGGQEFMLSALQPAELWKESGRWQSLDEIAFRLHDRKNADMLLGLTHEEAFTALARNGLSSYRQLPQIWYQIQTKFRDEARPKSGLLRVREFTMKDAYSFDVDSAGLDKAFHAHYEAYKQIFSRCGLTFTAVDASSGAMGGSQSTEFMVFTDAGEDTVAICRTCGYAANTEKAVAKLAKIDAPGDEAERDANATSSSTGANATSAATTAFSPSPPGKTPEEFATPDIRTIEQLANFVGGAPAQSQIKTLVYALDEKLTLILLRGDHELNETKLLSATGAQTVRPAMEHEIVQALGARPGSLGAVDVSLQRCPQGSQLGSPLASPQGSPQGSPLGSPVASPLASPQRSKHELIDKIVADSALSGRRAMVTGANKDDIHLRDVDVARDITVDLWADLRLVGAGELCAFCDGHLELLKALEIGHIFKLGTRYSETMGAFVVDDQGVRLPIVMGSYGIGVERMIAAIAELSNDSAGLIWPATVAPFTVLIVPTNTSDNEIMAAAEDLYKNLTEAGLDVLLDDRDERAGVKFNDADLVGIPLRVTLGKKVKAGMVELLTRAGRQSEDVPLDKIVELIQKKIVH